MLQVNWWAGLRATTKPHVVHRSWVPAMSLFLVELSCFGRTLACSNLLVASASFIGVGRVALGVGCVG